MNGKETATNKYYCSSKGWVEITDTSDNKTYKTVKIGDQVWMAEILNYADSVKTPSLKGNSWCYNNKAENCDVAGRLYTWAAAVEGVCPSGWHLPTNDEWRTLFTNVVGEDKAGIRNNKGKTYLFTRLVKGFDSVNPF